MVHYSLSLRVMPFHAIDALLENLFILMYVLFRLDFYTIGAGHVDEAVTRESGKTLNVNVKVTSI